MTLLAACGGGGGGGGGGGSSATPTPVQPNVFYVRASGSDGNDGRRATTAFATIGQAASLVAAGDTVIVGPGQYGNLDLNRKSGTDTAAIVFVADPSGTMTGDPPGPVEIDAGSAVASVRLTQSTHVTIDGFTLTGARGNNGAGIIIRSSSHNAIVRNCEIVGNQDGARVQDSDDVLIFNNLIRDSLTRGIFVGASGSGAGSQRVKIINNTVVANGRNGIFIGSANVASKDAMLLNNIAQDNTTRNIDINTMPEGSTDGLVSDFNLVFKTSDPPCTSDSPISACGYGPLAPRGDNDVNADAVFTDPTNFVYLLNQRDSPAIDRGSGDIDPGLAAMLHERTTDPRGTIDEDPIDLGYHYPQPET